MFSENPASDDSWDLVETSTKQVVEVSQPPIVPSSNSAFEDKPLQTSPGIAVIGAAGNFPGAQDADIFYERLVQGYSSITSRKAELPPKLPEGSIWIL